jgi:gentisate 1,2-dioxygenase
MRHTFRVNRYHTDKEHRPRRARRAQKKEEEKSMSTATTANVIPIETLVQEAQIFEYSKAADPISSGATPRVPIKVFSPDLYASGATRIVPLDLSKDLKTSYPLTGPSLLASFIRIKAGESIPTSFDATSEFYYVVKGSGHTETELGSIAWSEGDILSLPGMAATHHAATDTSFYSVNDSPLLAYLGVEKSRNRFQPTLYTRGSIMAELEKAKNDPQAGTRSRVSVLLANKNFEQTMTITSTLWSMFGIVPPGTRQLPHRHQSVALDFVVDAKPGAYTLLGPGLDADGNIMNATRVDWVKGAAFVTPAGFWHEHVNQSGADAYVMPIQDAGLHSYLRTLDIQFYTED